MRISNDPGRAARARTPHGAPPARPARAGTPWAARLLLPVAFVFPALFVAVAVTHVAHPYPLEWMEGAMAAHVGRVLAGRPLYVEPGLEFIPFTYTPLYVHASAAVARIVGEPLLALRFVAAASAVACMILLGIIVHRRTSRAWAGVLAGCLFAATYEASGFWFAVARNDTFALMLSLAGVALLVAPGGAGRPAAALAGAALGAAVLAKQSMALAGVLVALGLAAVSPGPAVVFAAAFLLTAGVPGLVMSLAPGGWFLYYVVRIPSLHAIVPGELAAFWTRDLLPVLPAIAATLVAAAAGRVRPRRAWWLDASALAALVLVAWLTRVRAGSFENVLMPAHAAVVWLCAASLPRAWDAAAPRGAAAAVALLIAAQLAVAWHDPRRLVPAAADRRGHDQIVASLAAVPGDVWVPGNGYLAERAGKKPFAHFVAVVDVLLDRGEPGRKLARELEREVDGGRWEIVVLDRESPGQPVVERWLQETIRPRYERYASMFAPAESTLCWTRTGHRVRPEHVYRRR